MRPFEVGPAAPQLGAGGAAAVSSWQGGVAVHQAPAVGRSAWVEQLELQQRREEQREKRRRQRERQPRLLRGVDGAREGELTVHMDSNARQQSGRLAGLPRSPCRGGKSCAGVEEDEEDAYEREYEEEAQALRHAAAALSGLGGAPTGPGPPMASGQQQGVNYWTDYLKVCDRRGDGRRLHAASAAPRHIPCQATTAVAASGACLWHPRELCVAAAITPPRCGLV